MIPDSIEVFDRFGDRQDPAWVAAHYGDLLIWRNEAASTYRVIALMEKEGPAAQVVEVHQGDGTPAILRVGRTWGPDVAGGQVEPELDPLPEGMAEWFPRGVYGVTNAEGHIGFGMGRGDYYDPKGRGASAVFCERPSDAVVGLGMLPGTNHRHLDVIFQWREGEPEPEPEPTPGPWQEIGGAVVEIGSALMDLGEALQKLDNGP